MFEDASGSNEFPSDAVETGEPESRKAEAERVVHHFSPPHGLLSESMTLVEISALGLGASHEGTRPHGRNYSEAEPVTDPIALEQLRQLSAAAHSSAIVARRVAHGRQVVLRRDLERSIVERLGDGLDPLSQPAHGRDVTATDQVMSAHIDRHPSESPLIVEPSSQGFGFSEIAFDPRELR